MNVKLEKMCLSKNKKQRDDNTSKANVWSQCENMNFGSMSSSDDSHNIVNVCRKSLTCQNCA